MIASPPHSSVPDGTFPPGFLWGAATSAYQVEGSPLADGAGPSIWHRFARTPGRIAAGDTGDVACGHYERVPQDIALMQSLGLTAYRFSLAWARVLPEGRGRVNEAGLAFYERLVDGLLAAGIEPTPTLYHWDLPAALDDRGGWCNPDIAEAFGEYADVVVRRLGDRVRRWTTINEPWVVTDGGYLHGTLAPGHRSAFEAAIAAHHLLRAHGRAVQACRAAGAREVGLVVNIEPKYPASASAADQAATRRAHAYMNRQFLDPVLLGRYPTALQEVFGPAWPGAWPQADMDLIRQPLDFIGLNYYTRSVVRHDESAWPVRAAAVRQTRATVTETGWEVFPQGLVDTLVWLRDRYGPMPLYVTENGAAFYDPPVAGAAGVDDPLRVDYLRQHLAALAQAIARGVDLRGYFAWSLFDNLEWALGFAKRFGIVHVDFDTLQRTPKASARFYADFIARQRVAAVQPPTRAAMAAAGAD